jgi:hypothetical protein
MDESVRKKIEQRAYEFFLKRGGKHGYHVEDWARAEKEILAEIHKTPASTVKPVQDEAKKTVAAKPVVKKVLQRRKK